MADAPRPSVQTIDQPAAPKPADGPLVFTMPAEYRYGGEGKKITEPAKAPPPTPSHLAPRTSTPPAPPVKPDPALPPTPLKQPKRSRISPWILVTGLILLLLLGGAAAYFALLAPRPPNLAPPVSEPPPPDTRPEPPDTRPDPPEPPEVPEPESPFPNGATPGVDTDSDGLTDLEERLIYGTDPRLPDSDADGFLDGNEVFHRYNPIALAPGTLLESGLVRAYDQSAVEAIDMPAIRLLYPTPWTTSGDYPETWFAATTGEVITFALLAKSSPEQTLRTFASLNSASRNLVASTTKNGFPSIMAEDQLTAYVDLGAFVAVFSYDTGVKGTVDYLQTFQMMINSLERT